MNRTYRVCLILVILCYSDIGIAQVQGVRPILNEILSSNITRIPDEYEADLSNCPVMDCVQWYKDLGESVYDGEYPDWIEIFNPGTSPINLSGYGLSDRPSDPYKWVFPDITLSPGAYLLVFASGKDKRETYIHTNFRIDRKGETILLTDHTGVRCDEVETGGIPVDFSLGRKPDGGTEWVLFAEPTPGERNATPVFQGFTDSIRPSHLGGFYSRGISLTLTADAPEAEIRYTLDGSEPTQNSSRYDRPISINRTTVVRARTFKAGQLSSEIMTHTYFIDEHFTIPVISLSTHPAHLWDEDLGIYVPGRNARESQRVANYWNDWERPVHVEFYEPDGLCGFSIDAGIKIFGWASRGNPQKSFAIMIRDRYGYPELEYPLFLNLPITTFQAFVLRAGGTDWGKTFFRDPFATSLLNGKKLDFQAFRPVLVFINGEYWGIQNIREKLNEDYLASHHGIDKENVDIISRYWRRTYPVVIEGDDVAYLEMEDFLKRNDLREVQHYEYIKTVVDIDHFLDYTLSQIYFANFDWPGNNNKCWRWNTPGSKWRWLMFDLDFTFHSNHENGYTHNTLSHATKPDGTGWPNPSWTTLILRKMLDSPAFRIAFINRMADLLNTVFEESHAKSKLDEMAALFRPEMPAHIDRWRTYDGAIPSMDAWESNVDVIRGFLEQRPTYVRRHFCDVFGLSGWDTLALNIAPQGAGHIQLHSIDIHDFPWTGTYFRDVPVRISVLPNPGYRFTGWTGIASEHPPTTSITLSLTEKLSITAHFEQDQTATNAMVIHEINYHSSTDFDPGDWVEIFNAYPVPVDLSGWVFKDEDEGHSFVFPEYTTIEPGGYLVICSDTLAFKSLFPNVQDYVGNLNFNLSNNGEQIRLLDDQGTVVDSVSYDDEAPWSEIPDGNGPTLALTAPDRDNAMAENWLPSSGNGTPGAANDVATRVEHEPYVYGDGEAVLPQAFALSQNVPNPFNVQTTIRYALPVDSDVTLAIYSITGQRVATLVSVHQEAGRYEVAWDSSGFATGLYLYRLEAEGFSATRRMLLLE